MNNMLWNKKIHRIILFMLNLIFIKFFNITYLIHFCDNIIKNCIIQLVVKILSLLTLLQILLTILILQKIV